MKRLFYVSMTYMAIFGLSGLYAQESSYPLWDAYQKFFVNARYIDLTHAFMPDQPVWPGFGNAKFYPAKAGKDLGDYAKKGEVFTYEKHGFVANAYYLPTDQYGTQLDPPAHWDPYYATIDELPPTYTLRPLVVIDISEKVKQDTGYHLQVSDILEWEKKHGRIPEGAVVMVRSDWSRLWPMPGDPDFEKKKARFTQKPFPGVSLEALKFLHEKRHILFHGHEPLDTDTTPNLEGEYWLMHHGYAQAEGVANLWKVPEAGCLIAIGYAKPMGGVGGYARYIAICPPDWKYGVSVKEVPGAPAPRFDKPLRWDEKLNMRRR